MKDVVCCLCLLSAAVVCALIYICMIYRACFFVLLTGTACPRRVKSKLASEGMAMVIASSIQHPDSILSWSCCRGLSWSGCRGPVVVLLSWSGCRVPVVVILSCASSQKLQCPETSMSRNTISRITISSSCNVQKWQCPETPMSRKCNLQDYNLQKL